MDDRNQMYSIYFIDNFGGQQLYASHENAHNAWSIGWNAFHEANSKRVAAGVPPFPMIEVIGEDGHTIRGHRMGESDTKESNDE